MRNTQQPLRNPANQQVQNPLQPVSGALVPFAGVLGNRTIARQNTLMPYPLLVGSTVNSSDAAADYHSMQVRVSKRLSNGLQIDTHYTWSKDIDTTDTGIEDGQGFNAGGFVRNYNIYDRDANRRLGLSDVPHRFLANFLYELPFGSGRALEIKNAALRAIVGEWQIGGTAIWQQGFPIFVSGAGDGGLNTRPDRVPGVPFELPDSLQGWYDGRTTITLPSGRQYTPPNNTFLKYNPDAFAGRTVTTPNGRVVADQFWYGDAALTYDDFRTDARFNIDFSLRRTFRIVERMSLDVGADAMNLLNHTQFNGAYTGALGGTNVTANPATGLVVGAGTSNSFGTRGRGTFNPRQIMLRAALRF